MVTRKLTKGDKKTDKGNTEQNNNIYIAHIQFNLCKFSVLMVKLKILNGYYEIE